MKLYDIHEQQQQQQWSKTCFQQKAGLCPRSAISKHCNNSHKEDPQHRFVDLAAKRDILTAVGEMVPLKVDIMMQHIHQDKSRSKQKRGNESNAMHKLACSWSAMRNRERKSPMRNVFCGTTYPWKRWRFLFDFAAKRVYPHPSAKLSFRAVLSANPRRWRQKEVTFQPINVWIEPPETTLWITQHCAIGIWSGERVVLVEAFAVCRTQR